MTDTLVAGLREKIAASFAALSSRNDGKGGGGRTHRSAPTDRLRLGRSLALPTHGRVLRELSGAVESV